MPKKKLIKKSNKLDIEDEGASEEEVTTKRGKQSSIVEEKPTRNARRESAKRGKYYESEDEEEDIKPKSKKNTKPNKKRKKADSDSDEEFKIDDREKDEDLEEEMEIRKKLANSKLDDDSDFEGEDDFSGDEFKAKTKRVKKSGGSNGQAAKKGNFKSGGKMDPVEKANKGRKGASKVQSTPDNIVADDNAGAGGQNEEHIDLVEASAYIPSWIQEPHVRDKQGRYSNEEGYDPTTLFVPEDEKKNLSPLLRQYWDFKADHFDKLVAVKVWKFYYFYFNDALIVHRIIDMKLSSMGKWTMTFFHESCLPRFAPKLLEKGYKIVVIEQMEEEAKSKEELVRREICQILTRGTYIEHQELDYSSRFFLSIYEENLNFGITLIDTTTHEIYLGEFKDDEHRANLRTVLTRMKPVEIAYIKNYLSTDTINMIKSMSNKPTFSPVALKEPKHFEDIKEKLSEYFTSKDKKKIEFPPMLEEITDTITESLKQAKGLEGSKLSEYEKKQPFYATMQALNISLSFLESVLLAETVIPMGHYQPFDLNLEKRGTLYLDSQALQNLEVLEVNYLNVLSETFSLFGYMDKTSTAFGKRLFKRWLTAPLLDSQKINERLEAVEDLMENSAIVDYISEKLAKLPDLERMINRIYNLSNKQRMSAVYFEDFAKNRLKDFLAFLKELKKVEDMIQDFSDHTSNFKSKRVIQLINFKDVDIEAFQQKKKGAKKTKEEKAQKVEGFVPRIKHLITDLENMVQIKDELPIPAPGVNEECDKLMIRIDEVKGYLNDYLEQQKKRFKSDDLRYVHIKHRYELEVPDHLVEGSKKPKEFVVTSKRKGYLRFHSPEIESQLHKVWALETEFQKILVPFICDYFRKFYERNSYWQQVISCLAELDCLCSLAKLANSMDVKCKPKVLPMSDKLVFDLRDMVHPVAAKYNPKFVRNDVALKNDKEIFLITGPNMGGKSTLLRQTCIAVIMAQMGSYVPASHFEFTCVDRIFTRIGAADRILEGKSTFFVEMEETHSIVTEATRNSLLIVDELGRGTSTYDGVAIAYSTLKYIAEKLKCITLFATHYHLLLEEFQLYQNISNYHMESEFDEEKDEIKFLYKFIEGQAKKSHGIVIAKFSGLPDNVIKVAKEKAAFMTQEKRNISFERNLMERFNKAVEELQEIEKNDISNLEQLLSELSLLN